MRTTDGPSALATFENARDSARASLGASVLGVTPRLAAAAPARPDAGPFVDETWKRDAPRQADHEGCNDRTHAGDES